MDSGTAARLRDVDTLAIEEFHLKILGIFPLEGEEELVAS